MSSLVFLNNTYIVRQKQKEDNILWSPSRKLTWQDFKGKNTTGFDTRKAETTTQIITLNTYYDENEVPVYEIGCFFLPFKSWTITSETFALEHEQLHFDIGELYTRKIRKKFDSLHSVKEKDFEIYRVIFDSLNIKCQKYNTLYDSEVYKLNEKDEVIFNHRKQKVWINKVKEEMQQLKDYEYTGND